MPETKITMISDPSVKSIYANYVSVTTNPIECTLTFCLIDPRKVSAGNIDAKEVSQILMPLPIAKNFVEIMAANIEKTEKALEQKK